MILGGTQATYMYTDNKGNTQYTNNKKIKNEAGDLRPNTDHPLHDPLKKYADAKAKADGLKKSPPMTKAEVDEHARDILVDMLIPKGEHMKPSANALAKGAEFLIDQWTEGGKGKTSTADASNGF